VRPPYPPMVRIANVVFSGTDENATAKLALRGAAWLNRLLAAQAAQAAQTAGQGATSSGSVTLIGPAPCPIERIKNRWRWHVLLKTEHSGALTRVARYFLERFEVPKAPRQHDLRVTVDRDPVALL
jgi:primosomal protein N' (replication factor Y) (superfamily II helicase)